MEEPNLNAETAASFVRRLALHLGYNINIMDRDGVIIASRDAERVGTFHEAAHRLVETGAEVEIVEPSDSLPTAVKPGVNLPIVFRGRTIGVVGITGTPAEVRPVAYAVKTSVESMVELEAFKDRTIQRLGRKNLLLNYLVFDEGTPRARIEELTGRLGYDAKLPRAPVILRPRGDVDAASALLAIKRNGVHGSADISWALSDGSILVFKALSFGEDGLLADYEAGISRYVAAAEAATGGAGWLRAYAGSFQTDPLRYRSAYRQALWLAARYPEPEVPVVYFYRHAGAYLASRSPRSEYVDAFDSFIAALPADFGAGLKGSLEALFESAFNGKEAAARLGIHRNTLSHRIARLAGVLGIDPRHDARARDLLYLLSHYLDLTHPEASRR